jgi:hypothetical protein
MQVTVRMAAVDTLNLKASPRRTACEVASLTSINLILLAVLARLHGEQGPGSWCGLFPVVWVISPGLFLDGPFFVDIDRSLLKPDVPPGQMGKRLYMCVDLTVCYRYRRVPPGLNVSKSLHEGVFTMLKTLASFYSPVMVPLRVTTIAGAPAKLH